MKVDTYFKKYGKIYGLSFKNDKPDRLLVFYNLDDAYGWLHKKRYDFQFDALLDAVNASRGIHYVYHKELMSKFKAYKYTKCNYAMYYNKDEDKWYTVYLKTGEVV